MAALHLIPEVGSEVIVINSEMAVVGRDPGCDIRLVDGSVSRQHAEIRQEAGRWLIRDLDSANGLMLDGRRISTDVLVTGQRIQIGTVAFQVKIELDADAEDATMVITRPSVPAGPRAPLPATVMATPVARRKAPEPPKSGGSGGLVLALGVVAVVVAAAVLWLRANPTAIPGWGVPPALPASETIVAPPPPDPAPQTSESPTAVTKAKGIILISTEVQATVSVDGQRKTSLPVGGVRRVEVRPGEHLVTFEVGKRRRQIVVRAIAGAQSVARLLERDLEPLPPSEPPSRRQVTPRATPPPARATPARPRQTPVPTAAPTKPPATPTPTPPPARAPQVTDAGLAKGVAAVKRADYYRALLLLNDAARRLDQDPQAKEELALAHAYLAWTYNGLNRLADARASAARAHRVQPDIASILGGFPPAVISLFPR